MKKIILNLIIKAFGVILCIMLVKLSKIYPTISFLLGFISTLILIFFYFLSERYYPEKSRFENLSMIELKQKWIHLNNEYDNLFLEILNNKENISNNVLKEKQKELFELENKILNKFKTK